MPPKEQVSDEPKSSATEEQEAAPLAEEETSDSSEETSTLENTDDEVSEEVGEADSDEDSELNQILKEGKDKSKDNVQRRIDQLTAQLKELKAENQKLQSKETPGKEPVYTDAQLKSAMKKAVEEGDADLIWDIIDYKSKQTEKDLVRRYEDEKRQTSEQYNKINQDWQKVTMDYSKVWEDDKGREIYAGAKRDLDITNEGSLLYKLAAQFYGSVDDDGSRPYAVQGGQRAAVADALSAIFRRKKMSPVDNDKKKLERQLAKAKRQKALAGAGSSEGDSPSSKGRPQTDADKLAEYIADRQAHRIARINR